MFKFSKISVLNLVSSEELHSVLWEMLQRVGVTNVFCAGSINEAFDIIRQNTIDILLVDDNPPKLDGIEASLTVRLAAKSPNPYLPIIFLGRTMTIRRTTQAVEAGVHVVMSQPFPAKKLTANIANCLANPPKFICSDSYFGPDRKALKGTVSGERKHMFHERSSVQQQVDLIEL